MEMVGLAGPAAIPCRTRPHASGVRGGGRQARCGAALTNAQHCFENVAGHLGCHIVNGDVCFFAKPAATKLASPGAKKGLAEAADCDELTPERGPPLVIVISDAGLLIVLILDVNTGASR